MKILQLGKFHPIRGGVEKVMLDLTTGLSRRGIECDMLCAATKGSYTIKLNPSANIFAVRALAKVKATMLSPAMIWRLRRIAKSYDIIHIHHPDPMAALALQLSGFRGRVVLHWHSDIVKQRLLLHAIRPLQSWLIRRADVIIGTSPAYIAQSPWLADVQKKCHCVPIGIDSIAAAGNDDINRIRARYGNRKIIFSMGRLVSYKGFEYLIDAARHLPDSYVVLIGGGGPSGQSLRRQIVQSGLESKVFLLGYVPEQELPAYYRAATIFCLPSVERTEAFGVVQIEAMSCGTPVVATEIPGSGVSWVNAHGISGLNALPANPESLANAIIAVDENRTKYSEGARLRFESVFTANRMYDNIMHIYSSLIEKRPE